MINSLHRGLFVVLYGANNLGKSTQVGMLADYLTTSLQNESRVIKYPIYESRFGQIINEILRGNGESRWQLDDKMIQWFYSEDRRDYQHELISILDRGINVVAEDYVGTGLAWGITKGVDLEYLLTCNQGLIKPDASILLDGERFSRGIETNHRHESAGQEVWERNRQIHLELAKIFDWRVVNANASEQKVQSDIQEQLVTILSGSNAKI